MSDAPNKATKKPVTIDYWRFNETNGELVAEWCGGRYKDIPHPKKKGERYKSLLIPTLEGLMHAEVGDVIIKGVQGEFYPCKPDIFEATYDKVES